MTQDEHGGRALALVRDPVTVPLVIALPQAVTLQLAQIVNES